MSDFPKYIQAMLALITSLLISVILIPVILKIAKKWKLFDHPDIENLGDSARKIHTQPIPRLGGIAMVIAFYVSIIFLSWPGDLWKIFLPALFVFLIGLKDDFKHIPPRVRLLLQFAVSAVTVYAGGLEFHQLIFTPSLITNIPYWAGFFLSVFILVGSVNAVNMVDGLDGLAGGLVLITITMLGYLFFLQTGSPDIFLFFTLPLVGAILGFLRYNTYPSKIFMGDCGSNWLGFMTGLLILVVANKNNFSLSDSSNVIIDQDNPTPLISVLLCMAIPILDTGFVITARLLRGVNPAAADKIHFHHGLMKIGLSHPNAVILIYFISLVIGTTGFFPILFQIYSSWVIPYVVPVLILLLLYFVLKLEENSAEKVPLYQLLFTTNQKNIVTKFSMILEYWLKLNQNVLFVILLAIPIFAGSQSKEIGAIAGIIFLLLVFSYLLQFWKNDFIDILFVSLGALVLLIANNSHEVKVILNESTYSIQNLYNVIFIFLTVSTLLFLLLTFKKQYLKTSPTDFLILILPLLLLVAPNSFNQKYNLTVISLRSMVLFLSIMTAYKVDKKLMEKFKTVIAFSLLYVFFTGYLGMKILF
ncbi:MAG: undecaprenyl/decaprenyl-phosphate alpha-N-acetylglucosaminyl 1-phosphate transferase [Spirochaetia bacterium]|nr:undecaprenyl/decaprenyl-phosphate alpha-N-acetylglucosaminyl 1-phosphate transferase [Spirochaetia bacterium]